MKVLKLFGLALLSACTTQKTGEIITTSLPYQVEVLTPSSCSSDDAEKILNDWRPALSQALLKDKTVKDRWFKKENKIYLRGPIEQDDFKYFLKLATKTGKKIDTVNVISTGGETGAGSLIGEYIYKHSIKVEVEGPCLSSCANYLFGFSKHRVILENGYVGFHGNHTAAVNAMGGVTEFLTAIKPMMLESLLKTNSKKFKTEQSRVNEVDKQLEVVKKNTLDIMVREKNIFDSQGTPQSFFDKTQTDKKGYESNLDAVDYSFLYPEISALSKLGFNVQSGKPQLCLALKLYSKINNAPTSVLIAR